VTGTCESGNEPSGSIKCCEFHNWLKTSLLLKKQRCTEGVGGVGVFKPPPIEVPKAFQTGAKLNPIVKTVKNC